MTIKNTFKVGKTYAAKKSVLTRLQFTITVLKRTPKFVTFQFDDDEEDIRKRKVAVEYGVEKICIHETNALDGDYEFSANDVVDEPEAAATVAEIDAAEISTNVDEYAIEIEEAAIVAGEARAIARILANETLKIRYDKAKTQVKYKNYGNGYCGWYFKGKHSDKWEYNETKATACLTRYGLSRFEFIIFSEDENAVIDNNGYDESAFELLPTVDELNDIDDEAETYTLTIYTDGDDTLVKNYDTCRHLHISGKYLIGKHSWKLARGGKTIATGDGVKDFCHFITCEFDVSERFAEIADVKSATLEICGESIWFRNGKCIFVYSPKYHASFHAEAGIDGNEHYEINKSDERGNFSRFEFVTEEEFFNTLERRGGCTVDLLPTADELNDAVTAEIEQAADTVAVPDTEDYFELADELDEIGNDICDTKDILAQKIAGGAPQTEIKSLEGYIDEREDEYRTLHKRIYDVNSQSDITVAAEIEQAANTVAEPDFAEKMASLTAEYRKAQNAYDEKREVCEIKHDEYQRACEAAEIAEIKVDEKREAIVEFGQTCAKDLCEKLFDDVLSLSPILKVTNQDGNTCETDFKQTDVFFHHNKLTFCVTTHWIFLGEYTAPAQVETVINKLKAAIEHGDRKFTFPTVDELKSKQLDSTIDSANEKARLC